MTRDIMTSTQAIEQLDWYFERDDGIAADPVTKDAYQTLRNIAIGYGGCCGRTICPTCGNVAGWDSYFGCYRCPKCGWESRDKGE